MLNFTFFSAVLHVSLTGAEEPFASLSSATAAHAAWVRHVCRASSNQGEAFGKRLQSRDSKGDGVIHEEAKKQTGQERRTEREQ